MYLLIFLILFSLNAEAFQDVSKTLPTSKKQDPKIEALLSQISALPVEMEADALLMLIDAGKLMPESVPSHLEDLFVRSGRASMRSEVDPVYDIVADTESGPGAYANASRILGLNQLTLQSRIVSRMALKDTSQASDRFDTIQRPNPPQSCKDAFRPIPNSYYATLFELYRKKTKGATEKRALESTDWLISHLGIHQAGEIEPVSRIILKFSGNKDIYDRITERFIQDLASITPVFSEYVRSLEDVSEAVISIAKKNDLLLHSNEALWRAFVSYNKRAFSGVRCSKLSKAEVDAALSSLRAKISGLSLPAESAKELLELEKIQPKSSDDGSPELSKFRDDRNYRNLSIVDYAPLRFGDSERRKSFAGRKIRPDGLAEFLPLEERKSSAWITQAQKFLRKIEDFRKSNEDEPSTHFSKVSGLYSALIELLPPTTELFSEAVSSHLAFLSGSPILKQSPVLWFADVKIMLRRGTLDDHEIGLKRLRSIIRSNGDQVLNTLLDVDQFNPLNNNANMNILFVK